MPSLKRLTQVDLSGKSLLSRVNSICEDRETCQETIWLCWVGELLSVYSSPFPTTKKLKSYTLKMPSLGQNNLVFSSISSLLIKLPERKIQKLLSPSLPLLNLQNYKKTSVPTLLKSPS